MRNIRLQIEYEGTRYCGWQAQRSKGRKPASIQETIEGVLRRVLGEEAALIGSGRTDAGVHAVSQVANFKTGSRISLASLQRALNALLPPDIAVTGVQEVQEGFHSRFSALSKLYRYTILNRPYRSVFLRQRAYFVPPPLDVRLMREEARVLLGRHDFASFRTSQKEERHAVRTITRCDVRRHKDLVYIDIEADGFLYNMVRAIAGTLVEIGRGKLPAGSMKRILRARDRTLAGPTAPACGLCLMQVRYT